MTRAGKEDSSKQEAESAENWTSECLTCGWSGPERGKDRDAAEGDADHHREIHPKHYVVLDSGPIFA